MAGATPHAVPISPHASARSRRMASAVSLGVASSGRSCSLDTLSRSRPGIVAERSVITCYGRVAPDLSVSVSAYHPGMAVLRSRLDPASIDSRATHDAMQTLVADLRSRQAALADGGAGGDDRAIERHRERGKLPV